MSVTFDDDALERRRQALRQTSMSKERDHEHIGERGSRYVSGGGAGGVESATGAVSAGAAEREAHAARTGRHGGTPAGERTCKPDIERIGTRAPPASHHRLRGLSELGVVRFADGAAVLLQGYVPGHLEQHGPAADHPVRWSVSRAGRVAPLAQVGKGTVASPVPGQVQKRVGLPGGADAARQERLVGITEPVLFMGMRKVDGQHLAILRCGEDVMERSVDAANVARLSRIAAGSKVKLGARGIVSVKGRSR